MMGKKSPTVPCNKMCPCSGGYGYSDVNGDPWDLGCRIPHASPGSPICIVGGFGFVHDGPTQAFRRMEM